MIDRFELYQACVQTPQRDVLVLEAARSLLHPDAPAASILSDDFSGPAALARAWADRSPRHHALAVDRDPEPLACARDHPRVRPILCDVRDCREPADIIAALNFAVCEWHTRADLLAYARAVRDRLRPGGVLACDLYLGPDAWTVGVVERDFELPDGRRVTYAWQQRSIDHLRCRVVNAIHFVVKGPGRREEKLDDAFVYDWRLWSIAELRDALEEVGLDRTLVIARDDIAEDLDGHIHVRPAEALDLEDGGQVLLVAGRPLI